MPQINSLWKHVDRHKALCNVEIVKCGQFYYLGTNQHVKNVRIHYAKGSDTILQKLMDTVVHKHCKKFVQFCT